MAVGSSLLKPAWRRVSDSTCPSAYRVGKELVCGPPRWALEPVLSRSCLAEVLLERPLFLVAQPRSVASPPSSSTRSARPSARVARRGMLTGRFALRAAVKLAVATDSTPIAFGDFQAGYLINDRIGTRVLRDPYTNKLFVHFYATRRVGAGLLDPQAIRLLRVDLRSVGEFKRGTAVPPGFVLGSTKGMPAK